MPVTAAAPKALPGPDEAPAADSPEDLDFEPKPLHRSLAALRAEGDAARAPRDVATSLGATELANTDWPPDRDTPAVAPRERAPKRADGASAPARPAALLELLPAAPLLPLVDREPPRLAPLVEPEPPRLAPLVDLEPPRLAPLVEPEDPDAEELVVEPEDPDEEEPLVAPEDPEEPAPLVAPEPAPLVEGAG